MRMGIHASHLAESVTHADEVLWFSPPNLSWDIDSVIKASTVTSERVETIDRLIQRTIDSAGPNTHIVIMSNGGFGGIHTMLIERLKLAK